MAFDGSIDGPHILRVLSVLLETIRLFDSEIIEVIQLVCPANVTHSVYISCDGGEGDEDEDDIEADDGVIDAADDDDDDDADEDDDGGIIDAEVPTASSCDVIFLGLHSSMEYIELPQAITPSFSKVITPMHLV
jgi:hypothetical protein